MSSLLFSFGESNENIYHLFSNLNFSSHLHSLSPGIVLISHVLFACLFVTPVFFFFILLSSVLLNRSQFCKNRPASYRGILRILKRKICMNIPGKLYYLCPRLVQKLTFLFAFRSEAILRKKVISFSSTVFSRQIKCDI